MKQVAKVLIKTGESYIFSRKRAPGMHKDKRLECLGGTLETGESPRDALIREAIEEESSGHLAAELRRQRPGYEKIVLRAAGMDEPQYLFHITVSPDVAETFEAGPDESYGFERIAAAMFDSDAGLKELRDQFTSKTIAILRAMGRSI